MYRRLLRRHPEGSGYQDAARRAEGGRAAAAGSQEPGLASQQGSAASSLENMFSALRQELRQDLMEFQGRTDGKLDQVQRGVRSAIKPLEARQQEMEGSWSAQEMPINAMCPSSWRTCDTFRKAPRMM